jgi:hypothetical protein
MTGDRREFCNITLMSCCGMAVGLFPGSLSADSQRLGQPRSSSARVPNSTSFSDAETLLWMNRSGYPSQKQVCEDRQHSCHHCKG